MSHYDRIARSFHERIDAIAGAVDVLASGLERAATQIVDAALGDRRLFICAIGGDAMLAEYAANRLRCNDSGLPPLPALAVVGVAGTDRRNTLWRDLRTLSRDGDILLCVDSSDGATVAREAADVARQRNLYPLLMSELTELGHGAALIPLSAGSEALRRELAMMSLHCLQSLIADLLMGEE